MRERERATCCLFFLLRSLPPGIEPFLSFRQAVAGRNAMGLASATLRFPQWIRSMIGQVVVGNDAMITWTGSGQGLRPLALVESRFTLHGDLSVTRPGAQPGLAHMHFFTTLDHAR